MRVPHVPAAKAKGAAERVRAKSPWRTAESIGQTASSPLNSASEGEALGRLFAIGRKVAPQSLLKRPYNLCSVELMVEFSPNAVCIQEPPSPQHAIDTLDGWVSILPPELDAKTTGFAPLFEDVRVSWAIAKLNGVRNAKVLELGPLEGGHTYMLDRAGAKSVLAIEGNKRCYLKCLVTKELLGIHSANFLLGDFVPWLETHTDRFDVIWASGVLYHMTDPLRLLRLLADRTDRLYIWTHFYPDDYLPHPLPEPLIAIEDREFEGEQFRYYFRSDMGLENTPPYCGGVYSGSAWLRRSDILRALRKFGFSKIDIGLETLHSKYGPSFSLVARRRRWPWRRLASLMD